MNSKKYDGLVGAEEKYWLDLQDTAKEVSEGVCEYLGLSEAQVDSEGAPIPWVCFGRIGFDDFDTCGFAEMERHKNLLHFALLLNFSLEPTHRPRSQYVLSLKLCKVGTKYQAYSTDAAIYPNPLSRGEYD